MNRPKIGSKYGMVKDKDIKEIAKLVRADIKNLKQVDSLPKSLKTSVKTKRYSGGQSLDVTITNIEGKIYNPEYVAEYSKERWFNKDVQRYSDDVQYVLKTLSGIVESYRIDSSDTTTDYYNTNFFNRVDIALEVREESLGSQLASIKEEHPEFFI